MGRMAAVAVGAAITVAGATTSLALLDGDPRPARPVAVPVAFEPAADAGPAGRFVARGPGGAVSLGDRAVTFALSGASARTGSSRVTLVLPGARPGLRPRSAQRLRGVVNDYRGDDPAHWRTGVPTYGRVTYDDVWPGVDVAFHSQRGKLEYDVVVAPGRDPRAVRLRLGGDGRPTLSRDGALVVDTGAGTLVQDRPVVFQDTEDGRVRVPGRFVVRDRDVGFAVGDYDRTRPLVIDPVILYSTFNGGTKADEGRAIAIDDSGNAVIAGTTSSADFPVVAPIAPDGGNINAGSDASARDAFVTKLSADGETRLFSTYFGGEGDEDGLAVAALDSGDLAVGGRTTSLEMPTTASAISATRSGPSDGFVVRLTGDGELVTSSYLGGAGFDSVDAVAGAPGAKIAVAGTTTSPDLALPGAVQAAPGGGADAFLARLSSTDAAVEVGSYHGGSGNEEVTGLVVDSFILGSFFVTGSTTSPNLPTLEAAQPALAGPRDAFVARFAQLPTLPENPLLFIRQFSTYHGGSGAEDGGSLAFDAADDLVVTGRTASPDLPLDATPLQGARAGASDLFVARFDAGTGVRMRSSYLGLPHDDEPGGVAVSPSGRVWVGATHVAPRPPGGELDRDVVVHRLDAALAARIDTTRVSATVGDATAETQRAAAADSAGAVHLTGATASPGFPTTSVVQPTIGGATDGYVTRLADDAPDTTPPETTITAGPSGPVEGAVHSFVFASTEPGTFRCALDGAPLVECARPYETPPLGPGAHTLAVAAVDAAGNVDPTPATRTFTILDATGPPPPPPPGPPTPPAPPAPPAPPPPAAPGAGTIGGPTEIPFGRAAVYVASFPGPVARLDWDLDGSGRFATTTGRSPRLVADFAAPGRRTVRVRATGPGGTSVAALDVAVARPVLVQVRVDPPRPRPGEKVRLRVVRKSEDSFTPLYYSWKVEGRKPARRTLKLSARRVARATAASGPSARTAVASKPVTVKLAGAEPTAAPSYTTSFPSTGVRRVEVAVVGGDGRRSVVDVDIAVGRSAENRVIFGGKPADSRRPANVSDVPTCTVSALGCGQIGVDPEPVAVGENATYTNLTPSSKQCFEVTVLGAGKGVSVRRPSVLDVLDLPYPATDGFFSAAAYPGGSAGALVSATSKTVSAKARSAQATQKESKEVCITFRTQTLSWDFGDGTVIEAATPPGRPAPVNLADAVDDPSAVAPPVVHHAYAERREYTLTVISRRFSLNPAKLPDEGDPQYLQKLAALLPIGVKSTDADTAELVAQGVLVPYVVKTTRTIEPRSCEAAPVTIGPGIPVRAFSMPAGVPPDPLSPAAIPGSLCRDNTRDVYTPRQGEYLSLNGVVVNPVGAADSFGVAVDRSARTITAAGGEDLELTMTLPSPFGARRIAAGRTQSIHVGSAASHPDVPGQTVRLADYGADPKVTVGGFKVVGGRIHLTKGASAFFLGAAQPTDAEGEGGVKLDEVITGQQSSPVLLGGIPSAAAAADPPAVPQPGSKDFKPGVEDDFSLDLSGKSLGPLGVKTFVLAHYPGDGWYGAGDFLLPMGATDYRLSALYRPQGDLTKTSIRCADASKKGPSGLYISDSAGFQFAGAQFTATPGIVVGPVELGCFAASVTRTKKAFTIIGYLGGRFPPSVGAGKKKQKEIASLDVCALVAVLEKDGTTGGCGIQAQEFGVTVPGVGAPVTQDQTWVAVRGQLRFVSQFDVNGGVDFRTGDNLLKISANAGITPRYYGPWRIGGSVFGRFNIKPEFGFAIGGEVELALVACPFCADVKALVSSKGIGACAEVFIVSGGFRYEWGGSLALFTGCGWDVFAPINIAKASSTLVNEVDLRAPPGLVPAFGAVAQETVTVSEKDAERPLTFEMFGRNGFAPRTTLTAPGGRTISVPAAPGVHVLDEAGRRVTNARRFDPNRHTRIVVADALSPALLGTPVPAGVPTLGPGGGDDARRPVLPEVEAPFEPVTLVSVPRPERGDWRIATQPGSVEMTTVRKRRRGNLGMSPRAKVVRARAGGRTLEYKVPTVPGRRVRFVEEGRTLQREIGVTKSGRGGTGRLRMPTERGSSGRRVIRALVEQDGLLVEEHVVARYTQPPPPPVPRPRGVSISASSSEVKVCWRSAPGAEGYVALARTGDGVVELVETKATCARFRGLDSHADVRVSVRAMRSYGESDAVRATRKAPAAPIVLTR